MGGGDHRPGGPSRYGVSIAGAVFITSVLTAARVVEIVNGHQPTPALTAAFSAAVTGTLALIAAGRLWRER